MFSVPPASFHRAGEGVVVALKPYSHIPVTHCSSTLLICRLIMSPSAFSPHMLTARVSSSLPPSGVTFPLPGRHHLLYSPSFPRLIQKQTVRRSFLAPLSAPFCSSPHSRSASAHHTHILPQSPVRHEIFPALYPISSASLRCRLHP